MCKRTRPSQCELSIAQTLSLDEETGWSVIPAQPVPVLLGAGIQEVGKEILFLSGGAKPSSSVPWFTEDVDTVDRKGARGLPEELAEGHKWSSMKF